MDNSILYQIKDKWLHNCSVCLEESKFDEIPTVHCSRCGCCVHCLCHGLNLKAVANEDHSSSFCSESDISESNEILSYSSESITSEEKSVNKKINKKFKNTLNKENDMVAKKEESELNSFVFLCEQCKLNEQNCCSICYQYGGIMKKLRIKAPSVYLSLLSKMIFPELIENKKSTITLWAHPICFKLLRGIVFDPQWNELILDGETQFDLIHGIFADSISTIEIIDGEIEKIPLSSILNEEWFDKNIFFEKFQQRSLIPNIFLANTIEEKYYKYKNIFFTWDSKEVETSKTVPWSFINENKNFNEYKQEKSISGNTELNFVTAKIIEDSKSESSNEMQHYEMANNNFIEAIQCSDSTTDTTMSSEDVNNSSNNTEEFEKMSPMEKARRDFYKNLDMSNFIKIFFHKTCAVCGINYGLLIKCECPDDCSFYAHPSCMILGNEPFVEKCPEFNDLILSEKRFKFYIPNSMNHSFLAKLKDQETKNEKSLGSQIKGKFSQNQKKDNFGFLLKTFSKSFVNLTGQIRKQYNITEKSLCLESHFINRELHQQSYILSKEEEIGRLIIQHLATTDRLIPLCKNHAKQPWEEIEFEKNMAKSNIFGAQYFSALKLNQLIEASQPFQLSSIPYNYTIDNTNFINKKIPVEYEILSKLNLITGSRPLSILKYVNDNELRLKRNKRMLPYETIVQIIGNKKKYLINRISSEIERICLMRAQTQYDLLKQISIINNKLNNINWSGFSYNQTESFNYKKNTLELGSSFFNEELPLFEHGVDIGKGNGQMMTLTSASMHISRNLRTFYDSLKSDINKIKIVTVNKQKWIETNVNNPLENKNAVKIKYNKSFFENDEEVEIIFADFINDSIQKKKLIFRKENNENNLPNFVLNNLKIEKEVFYQDYRTSILPTFELKKIITYNDIIVTRFSPGYMYVGFFELKDEILYEINNFYSNESILMEWLLQNNIPLLFEFLSNQLGQNHKIYFIPGKVVNDILFDISSVGITQSNIEKTILIFYENLHYKYLQNCDKFY